MSSCFFIRRLSFRLFLLRWLVEHFCSVEGIISVPSHRAESFHAKEHFCSVGTFTKMLLGTVMRPLLRSIRSASSSERNARLCSWYCIAGLRSMMKWEKLHRRSRAHPPSCSFEKALPCQAAECRAALPCGLGLYPAKSGHRADIAAAAYWVSNNLKWHSPPFFTSNSVARQFRIAVSITVQAFFTF